MKVKFDEGMRNMLNDEVEDGDSLFEAWLHSTFIEQSTMYGRSG